MADSPSKTKRVLEDALRELYQKAASERSDSYLLGGDNAFLGKITADPFDSDSLTNQFGPYGNPYSATSIFNQYSVYGNPYSMLSVSNPFATAPPELFINGEKRGRVTKNAVFTDRIDTDQFIKALFHDVTGLLSGHLPVPGLPDFPRGTFIQANDGTFLGNLDKSKYDHNSVFNKYGPFGSKYAQTSIFNKYGPYGSKYSVLSPFNQYSTTPPILYVNSQPYAYLSKNRYLGGKRIDPDELWEWIDRNR